MSLKNFMAARGEQQDVQVGSEAVRMPAPSERPPRTVAPSTAIDAESELTGTLHCTETLRIDGSV